MFIISLIQHFNKLTNVWFSIHFISLYIYRISHGNRFKLFHPEGVDFIPGLLVNNRMNRKWQLLKYLTFDLLSAITAWILFFKFQVCRFSNIFQGALTIPEIIRLINWDLVLIPAYWLFPLLSHRVITGMYSANRGCRNSVRPSHFLYRHPDPVFRLPDLAPDLHLRIGYPVALPEAVHPSFYTHLPAPGDHHHHLPPTGSTGERSDSTPC